jgi:hypothetical protein
MDQKIALMEQGLGSDNFVHFGVELALDSAVFRRGLNRK